MAKWDGPYLLGQFNRLAGRPDSDQIQDETKYLWLSEAQNEVVADIASRMPEVLYFAGVKPLITLDQKVWTYGLDADSNPIFPIGKTTIYSSPTAYPSTPLNAGWDYLDEGNQIEIPNGRTFPGQLYFRGIIPPGDIDATHPPALQPPQSREMITMLAVKNFGQAGNINPDLAAQMTEQWSRAFPRWMLVYRTQYANGGALGPLVSNPVVGPYAYAAYWPGTSGY